MGIMNGRGMVISAVSTKRRNNGVRLAQKATKYKYLTMKR
jgi:hypothetical protein